MVGLGSPPPALAQLWAERAHAVQEQERQRGMMGKVLPVALLLGVAFFVMRRK